MNGAFFRKRQPAPTKYALPTLAYQSSRKEVEIKTGGSLKISISLKPATFIMKEINVSENYREAAKEIITARRLKTVPLPGPNLLDLGGLQVFRTTKSQ